MQLSPAPGLRRGRGRGPAQDRAQCGGYVGEELDVVLMVKAGGQRERHFIDFLESGMCVQLFGDLLAGADEVRGKQNPFSPAQMVDFVLAAPYQRRSRSPDECGSTPLENSSSTPCLPENLRTGSPAIKRASRSTRA